MIRQALTRKKLNYKFKLPEKILLWLSLSILAITLLFSVSPVEAQTQPEVQETVQSARQESVSEKKSFLDNFPRLQKERQKLKKKKKYVVEIQNWQNKPKPPVASFLFCCLISGLAIGFFAGLSEESKAACKSHYWRCFGRALVANISLFVMFRIFIENKVTQPLAILFAGVLQLLLVAGLAVSILMIGESLVTRLKLDRPQFISLRPKLKNLLIIFAGSLIACLLIQIPDLGRLPKPGMRIVLLIATLGEGGLLAVLRRKRD